MARLTDHRYEAFAVEYAKSRNAAQAARVAGSTAESAKQAGYELLLRPEIRARVTELSSRLLEVADMSANRLVLELGRMAHIDHRRFQIEDTDPKSGELFWRQKYAHELDDDEAACVKGYDRAGRFQFWDKTVAATTLAKHFKVIGDEGDGVSALANALADRLTTARKRTDPEPTPRPVVDTSAGEPEDLA